MSGTPGGTVTPAQISELTTTASRLLDTVRFVVRRAHDLREWRARHDDLRPPEGSVEEFARLVVDVRDRLPGFADRIAAAGEVLTRAGAAGVCSEVAASARRLVGLVEGAVRGKADQKRKTGWPIHDPPDLSGGVTEELIRWGRWEAVLSVADGYDLPALDDLVHRIRKDLAAALVMARSYRPPPLASTPPTAVSDRPADDLERATLLRLALAELLLTGPNVKRIAEKIGVPRTTLLGWPDFVEHLDRARAAAETRKRGRKGRRVGESVFADD